jgi:hypothetical protein
MAGTRAGARKDASLWVLEATAVMQSADKGQTAHGSDHLLRGHVWRGVGHDEAVKDRCQRSS